MHVFVFKESCLDLDNLYEQTFYKNVNIAPRCFCGTVFKCSNEDCFEIIGYLINIVRFYFVCCFNVSLELGYELVAVINGMNL